MLLPLHVTPRLAATIAQGRGILSHPGISTGGELMDYANGTDNLDGGGGTVCGVAQSGSARLHMCRGCWFKSSRRKWAGPGVSRQNQIELNGLPRAARATAQPGLLDH